jgi:endonuclease/exonuclease/phosphatase family metal-dependent hydrolase
MKTRIITINLAGTKDNWFGKRRDLMIEGLTACKPDIVCVQETTLTRGYVVYDQARDIGEAIGLPVTAFAPYGNSVEIMSSEQGGVAILSRWPMIRVRNRRLPAAHENPPDSRVALFATFQTPAGELKVVTTHLSWEPDSTQMRMMQMGLILDDLFQSRPLDPYTKLVLTGDLNAIETEPVVALINECLRDSFRHHNPDDKGYTWSTRNPLTGRYPIEDRRLDYIFCPTGAEINKAGLILNDEKPGFASDHFGVLADIEWREAQKEAPKEAKKAAA